MTNKFKVGDVVICHSRTRSNDKKGFIEEIIDDPNTSWNRLRESGMYSIYGLTQEKFNKYDEPHVGDYYFGDHLGSELEAAGESMTVEQLKEFRKKLVTPEGDGFAKDIDIVIKNLGRTEGRNA